MKDEPAAPENEGTGKLRDEPASTHDCANYESESPRPSAVLSIIIWYLLAMATRSVRPWRRFRSTSETKTRAAKEHVILWCSAI
jgi:hypothetical protein